MPMERDRFRREKDYLRRAPTRFLADDVTLAEGRVFFLAPAASWSAACRFRRTEEVASGERPVRAVVARA